MTCTDLRRGRDLDRCSLSVPLGARLLLVSDPDRTASLLLRVLAGLARLDHGRMWVAGLNDPTADGWGRRVAYLGRDSGLHDWMTPLEALQLTGRLLGLPSGEAERRIREVTAWARIPSAATNRAMRRGGQPLQQRTGLAAALMGEPEVLLLDDPLRAIDQDERRQLLKLPGDRLTVLMASRYPASEVGLATGVGYLRDGRLRAMAPIEALGRAGLPLSQRGISELADQLAADEEPAPADEQPAADGTPSA
ncbi:MAG: ATP-binding cassette domain-containing protein [Chloroflexi bacterium]|nr:ATP-binding cassette domain-containing protein [Chloroflexota bacterium]